MARRKAVRNRWILSEKEQKKLVLAIFDSVNKLVQSRGKLPYDPTWFKFMVALLKGDPAPDSATLTFNPATSTVTVTVTLPSSSGRTTINVFASQDPSNLEEEELASAASQPSSDQLGADYDYQTGDALFVKMTYTDSSGRHSKLAEFTVNQVNAEQTVTQSMSNYP